MVQVSNIAKRLIIFVIIFSGLLSILVTSTQLFYEFKRDESNLNSRLKTIELTTFGSLTNAVWISDKEQINYQLQGIYNNPEVIGIKLITQEGNVFRLGRLNDTSLIPNKYPLVHHYAGRHQKIGTLEIQSSLDPVYDNLYERLGYILISNSIKTFLVAAFISLLFYRLITRHVLTISRYVKNFDLDRPSDLCLDRPHRSDELETLKDSINALVGQLKRSITDSSTSERRTRSILNSTAQAIYGIDVDGRCIFANPTCLSLLGYKHESDLIGKDMHRLIHHSHANGQIYDERTCRINDIFSGTTLVNCDDEVFWRKDNSFFRAEYSATPMHDVKGEVYGAVICFTDISEKLETLARLDEAKEMAENASSSKSEFLANMSHEIRTPMNAILGMTELALNQPLNQKERSYIQTIATAGKHLLAIINDILDFSKIEAGKLTIDKTVFSIKSMIQEIEQISRPNIDKKGLEFTIDYVGNIPDFVSGDKLRIHQVLLNLVNNAMKFTIEGGIFIKVQLRELDDNSCIIEFSVRDSGIGINEEKQAHLFEAFNQGDGSTTRRFGGSGLGLSISKHLVELMGGEISVKSVEGLGSLFVFSCPFDIASQEEFTELEGQAVFDCSNQISGSHILLVEDNDINQRLALELLERANTHVDVAQNGEVALDYLAGDTAYQAVLMDIQMPVLDGYETTKRIRQDGRHDSLPIIAMTANAMAEDRQRCLEAGMDDYMSKPVDSHTLYYILAKWINPQSLSPATPAPVEATEDLLSPQACEIGDRKNKDVFRDIPIPHVDKQAAMQKLDNDLDLFNSMLKQFSKLYHSFGAEYSELEKRAFESGENYNERHRLVHNLKSAAGIIGAQQLRQLAQDIEVLSKTERTIDNRLLQAAQDIIDEIVQFSSTYLEEMMDHTDIREPLETTLSELNSLLKDHDTRSRLQAEKLQKILSGTVLENHAQEIKSLLERYRFKQALEKLQELEDNLQHKLNVKYG